MSNQEPDEQASQDALSAVDSNIVPPLDLNLDLDNFVSSSATPQRVSGLEWLQDTLADDVVESNSVLVPKGRCGKPGD